MIILDELTAGKSQPQVAVFKVRDSFYVAKYQSGKRFAVGVPVKARFGKNKWLRVEGLKNDGNYLVKRKYYSLAKAKASACGLAW